MHLPGAIFNERFYLFMKKVCLTLEMSHQILSFECSFDEFDFLKVVRVSRNGMSNILV